MAADIALPSLSDAADVGEAELQDPLPWDRVPPSDFTREDHVSAFLNELRARSAARVAGDKDFAYLREDIAQFKKSLATKTVDLNEADRRRETEEAKARAEVRKQERAARKESQPTTYEITLENADAQVCPRRQRRQVCRRPNCRSPSLTILRRPGPAFRSVIQSFASLSASWLITWRCCTAPPHWPWQRIDG